MRTLPQDEFALEMRNHFLDSTLQALDGLLKEASMPNRLLDMCADWEQEASANDLPFFAALLESIRLELRGGSLKFSEALICKKLARYLVELKSSGDREEFRTNFYDGPNSGKNTSSSASLQEAPIETAMTYLQCRRGEMRFLLPVDNVVEISKNRKVNPLPVHDSRVKGLIGFRGQGTPVIDLKFAGFPHNEEKSFFVICEHEKSFFALEVNATDDVLRIKPSEFQQSSAGLSSQFTTKEKQILLLLDISELFEKRAA